MQSTSLRKKRRGLRGKKPAALRGTTRLDRGFEGRGAWLGLTRRNASSQGTGVRGQGGDGTCRQHLRAEGGRVPERRGKRGGGERRGERGRGRGGGGGENQRTQRTSASI